MNFQVCGLVQLLPLLTEAQVADLLGVSIRTLQAWRLHGGGPPFIRLADEGKRGAIRYGQSDLVAFVSRRAAPSHVHAGSAEPSSGAPRPGRFERQFG